MRALCARKGGVGTIAALCVAVVALLADVRVLLAVSADWILCACALVVRVESGGTHKIPLARPVVALLQRPPPPRVSIIAHVQGADASSTAHGKRGVDPSAELCRSIGTTMMLLLMMMMIVHVHRECPEPCMNASSHPSVLMVARRAAPIAILCVSIVTGLEDVARPLLVPVATRDCVALILLHVLALADKAILDNALWAAAITLHTHTPSSERRDESLKDTPGRCQHRTQASVSIQDACLLSFGQDAGFCF